MRKKYYLSFVCVMIAISNLFAGTTGKIAGRVIDKDTGEPLAGANVIIKGSSMGAATNMDGNYSILNISPGSYTVNAMMIGYATLSVEDIRINVDLTRKVDFELGIESIKGEEVVVVAERRIIKMDVASSQTNISTEEIDDLPVTSIEGVIGLQAGAEGLSIRKGGEDELAMLVDGISLKDDRTGKPISGIPLSSVQEIMIQSGGFSAEYSDLQAGVVNVVTKEGGKQNYTFNLNYKHSPPASKHFGISIYDPNSIYMKPFLDDDVCWNGTISEEFFDLNGNQIWDEGETFVDRNNDGVYYQSPWNKYEQAHYPSFEGWNAVSQELLSNNDPNDDLTPTGAQRLFEWQHRRQGDITESDHNIDLGVGGPVPFISAILGDLRFYTSFRSEKEMFLIPLTRDSYNDWSLNNKFTSDISDKIKLQITAFVKETKTVSSSGTGQPSWFTSVWDVAAQFGSSSQQRSKIFYPDYYCDTDISNRVFASSLTHILSQKTFYEVAAEYATTAYLTGPGKVRDTRLTNDIFPGDAVFFADEAPWGFETSLASKSIDGFMMGAKSNSRDSTKTARFNVRFDLVNQANQENQIKFGFIVNYWNYKMNYGAVNPDLPVGRPYSKWEKSPWQIGAYLQDKLEYEGWIATLGLRVEYFDPNTEWYDLQAYDKSLFSSNYKDDKDDELKKVKAKRTLTFLPRLGINHPITVNSKLYFNYGHMRQRFQPDELFGIRRVTGGQMSLYGNPELPMEKTISYELGYDHALFNQYLFHVAAYYKDKSDQSGTIAYKSADNTVSYDQYTNNFYQDIRGLEIEMRKNRGDWVTGFANYTYAVYSDGSFGVQSQYENPSLQRQYELNVSTQAQYKPIPRPRLNFNLSLHTPKFNESSRLTQLLYGGWDISFTGYWLAGSYDTFGNVTGVTYNVRWKDTYNVNMKLAKTFTYNKLRITAIADVFNVFNFKHFSTTGWGDSYLTPEVYTRYTESLHFSEKVYDELGEKYIAGNDKLGDYRPAGVKYQPMDYVYKISDNFTGDRLMIYLADEISLSRIDLSTFDLTGYNVNYIYNDDGSVNFAASTIKGFDDFVQLNNDGVYEKVSKSRINKILDDKAYIFNPANESFMFLSPRDVFFGIRVSYEL